MCHTFLSVCDIIVKRPDVVHVHNIGPGMFIPMLKLFGRRVGITYHSPNYEHKKWGWIARNILKFSEWLSLNFADEVIFVNKFQMEKVGQTAVEDAVFQCSHTGSADAGFVGSGAGAHGLWVGDSAASGWQCGLLAL